MNKVLLVSHATLADGMKSAAQLILGDLIKIDSLGLQDGQGIESFALELEALLVKNEYHKEKNFIILADLKGGSPQTKTMQVLQKLNLLDQAKVISGMSLPLVLSIALLNDLNSLDKVINDARNNISLFEVIDEEDEEL